MNKERMFGIDKKFAVGDRVVLTATGSRGTIERDLGEGANLDGATYNFAVRWDNGMVSDTREGRVHRLVAGKLRLAEIEQITGGGSYEVSIPWNCLKTTLADYEKSYGLELNPDFQRGHVWDDARRTAYVEFLMRGGKSARTIYFNCPAFGRGGKGNMVLVDGLQRITAVLNFLDDKLPAFGQTWNEWVEEDRIFLSRQIEVLRFNVNDLPTRADVLKAYLDFNDGGIAHSAEELARVRNLLAAEN